MMDKALKKKMKIENKLAEFDNGFLQKFCAEIQRSSKILIEKVFRNSVSLEFVLMNLMAFFRWKAVVHSLVILQCG